MFQNKTKIYILLALLLCCAGIFSSLKTGEQSSGVIQALGVFRKGSVAFALSSLDLKNSISALDRKDSTTLIKARAALKNSRLSYKKIEFFMDYFFESSSMIYNRPAKVEVDEPYMEYQEPAGFQVIEVMLFDTDPLTHKTQLIEQAEVLSSSAADLNSLLYGFAGTDQQLLESLRLSLVKVIALGITGYDAPELKSGIEESWQSIKSVSDILIPYLQVNTSEAQVLSVTLKSTMDYLYAHPDFDSFDRMEFLTGFALPLQEQLGAFINAENLDSQGKSILNYKARNLFSRDAIPEQAFYRSSSGDKAKIALGKALFSEKKLSGNLKISCASCHHPEQYFSDGLKTSQAFDGKSFVQRNAPGLLYAGFQYAQFWDGRVKTVQEQIKNVISNPTEMHGDHAVVTSGLNKDTAYLTQFKQVYGSIAANKTNGMAVSPTEKVPLNIDNVADALAAFVMQLSPRNSDFDQYISGNEKAMTEKQVKGFNLFMGKAQCGSCHFAPLFNGLIPPLYSLTEYEVLGTPANDDFEHLIRDADQGRFGFFPITFYQAAFKTPTVRNVAKTAPYMHNGAFKDLEKVVEFYNQGGGAGLGLNVPQQTLSAKPLHLTNEEVKQIVAFMESLTDKLD